MLIAKPEQIIANENGTAFKLAGGTLICARSIKIQQGSSSATVQFPSSFIFPPIVLITNIFSFNSGIIWSVGNQTTSEADVYAHFTAGDPSGSSDAYLLAIGRWK